MHVWVMTTMLWGSCFYSNLLQAGVKIIALLSAGVGDTVLVAEIAEELELPKEKSLARQLRLSPVAESHAAVVHIARNAHGLGAVRTNGLDAALVVRSAAQQRRAAERVPRSAQSCGGRGRGSGRRFGRDRFGFSRR